MPESRNAGLWGESLSASKGPHLCYSPAVPGPCMRVLLATSADAHVCLGDGILLSPSSRNLQNMYALYMLSRELGNLSWFSGLLW